MASKFFSQQYRNCTYNSSNVGSNCTAYDAVLPYGSEASLQAAVATIGPISVCIDASETRFDVCAAIYPLVGGRGKGGGGLLHGIQCLVQCPTAALQEWGL